MRRRESPKKEKNNRRAEILEASLDLFIQSGYESAPIHEIASEVGTSHSNVHYHFRHKEDIVRALFEPSLDRIEELLEQADTREELLEGYLEIMLEGRKLTTLLAKDISILSVPYIRLRVQEQMRGLRNKVAGHSAKPEEIIRAECALWVLRSGVISTPEYEARVVGKVALPAALAVLDSR